MKKFLLALALWLSVNAHADYTVGNKIIKVVIPQPPTSGLGYLYSAMETYARKQNITMMPVFKPGANGKIGIEYASENKNNSDTLLFSTVSDYVTSANDSYFDKLAPISKTSMVLVASKKSKIEKINDIVEKEQNNPGKLAWGYTSSATLSVVDGIANSMQLNEIYKVPFSTTTQIQGSIINGDLDLALLTPLVAESLATAGRISIVNIDKQTKEKILIKENATGLFLPKTTNSDAYKFWNEFTKGMMRDDDFKESMKKNKVDIFTDPNREELIKVINNWKL